MKAVLDFSEKELVQRTTRNFVLLIAISAFLNLARWFFVGIVPEIPWLLTFIASGLSVALLGLSKKLNLKALTAIFFTCTGLLLFTLAHTNFTLARSGADFSPFAGFKLTAIAVAVFAPLPAWFGYVTIAACGLIPVAMYHTLLQGFHENMSFQEPWLTLTSAVVCFFILQFRIRGLEIERSYARLSAEKRNLDEVARIFLALRDLTNTPLQTIRIAANLLETNSLTPTEAAQHLKGSLDRLTQLTRLLAYYEQDREFVSKYESFDAVVFLEQKLSALKEKAQNQSAEKV